MISHTRSKFAVPVGLLLATGLMAFAGFEAAPSGQAAGAKANAATTIVVTAGKPSELAFKLSKTSLIPAGVVIFKVTNSGKIGHTFRICTTPRASAAANTCTGKTTRLLKAGQSQTLTVTLKKGKYEFVCTLPGHAAAGMKGLIGVGVKVTAPPKPTTTTPTATTPTKTTTTTTTTAGGSADGCPPGQTIQSLAADDHDDDDTGGPTDGDGCV